MAKRKKEVFSDYREIAHLWAHQAQDHARSSGRGSFYYDGDTIYSYGSHFPIAKLVEKKRKGKKTELGVLYTYREYSSTTSSHKSAVLHAIPPDRTIIYVKNPNWSEGAEQHKENWKEFLDKIEEFGTTLSKARSDKVKNRCMAQINTWADRANTYAKWYGLRWKIKGDAVSQAKSQQKRLIEMAMLEGQRAQHRLQQKLAVQIEQWKRGEITEIEDAYHLKQVYLRIDREQDEIETSQGARFPVEHGLKAVPIIERCIEKKEVWETNGKTIHLGHYKLDRIEADGTVVAGCHRVGFSEIKRILEQLEKDPRDETYQH